MKEQYTIVNGRIADPGEFKGTLRYVPYFWKRAKTGEGDWSGSVVLFEVSNKDIERFPELKGIPRVGFKKDLEDGVILRLQFLSDYNISNGFRVGI